MRKPLSILFTLLLICSCAFADVVTPSEPDPRAQAWTLAQGQKCHGKISELISLSDDGIIYVQTKKTVELSEIDARTLIGLRFVPDADAFWSGEVVKLSLTAPEDAPDPATIDRFDPSIYEDEEEEVLCTVYIWVYKKPEPTSKPPVMTPGEVPTPVPTTEPGAQPTAKPTETPEPTPKPVTISVASDNYVQGAWTNQMPTFTLSGKTDSTMEYAVILFDREIHPLSEDTFTPDSEGITLLRFVILDAMGDIVSASDAYTTYIDMTPPDVFASPAMRKSYALVVSAFDAQSGAEAVSIDGGKTWNAIDNDTPYRQAFGKETTLAPGMLQVTDAAGNLWQNDATIVCPALPSTGPGYFGGMPAKPHAENQTGNEGTVGYAETALASNGEPLEALQLSGHSITLGRGEESSRFTVSFGQMPIAAEESTGLANAHTGAIAESDNLLLLTAVAPENAEDTGIPPETTWHFDGAALRALYASGIDYLLLQQDSAIAVLPTQGFTAGTEYTRLKIDGVSSKYFAYALSLAQLSEDAAREPDAVNRTQTHAMTITVSVAEQTYTLLPAQDERMYAENVCCCDAQLLDTPMDLWPEIPSAN